MLNALKRNRFGVVFALAFMSPLSFALDGIGTVDEIRICMGNAQEEAVSTGWQKLGIFRLSDNKWFGSYLAWQGPTATDYDGGPVYATALAAFSTNAQVQVRANFGTYNVCGVDVAMVWNNPGDYITLTK